MGTDTVRYSDKDLAEFKQLIKEKIQADKFRYISKTRANDLSEEEVLKLAEEFIKSRKNKVSKTF